MMMKYKISDICDLNLYSITNKDKIEKIIYLDTSSITNNNIELLQPFSIEVAPSRAKRKVKNNTIIYSTVRPNLKHFGILKNPADNMIVSTGFTTIDVKDKYKEEIDAEYIYLLLSNQSVVYYLSTMAESAVSAYPSINPDDIGELRFDFPNIDMQRKIAAAVFSIEEKIALNTRINAELEAMAKQLYDYWFVQFDFPDENGRPYKSSGGKMVYNEKLKREIPEGWEVSNYGTVFEVKLGGTPSTSEESFWNNGTINWLNSGEIQNFPVNSSEKKITKAAIEGSSTEFLPKGSVLISITRYLRVTILNIDACINQSVVGFAQTKKYKYPYTYFALSAEVPRLMSLRTGAQQPHINKEIIEVSPLLLPPDDILNHYYAISEPVISALFKHSEETSRLTHLRDSLLPMLMNGQVIVE